MNVSGGLIIVSCVDVETNLPNGQLVLDYLTDEIVSFRPSLLGKPRVAPDSQYVVTLHSPAVTGERTPDSRKQTNINNNKENHTNSSNNDVTIVVQAVTDTGGFNYDCFEIRRV